LIEVHRGLTHATWRAAPINEKVRTAIFAARLAIVASLATMEIQAAIGAKTAVVSMNSLSAGRTRGWDQEIKQLAADIPSPSQVRHESPLNWICLSAGRFAVAGCFFGT
jgi:hypothetical protein